jgi:tartrate dehydratase alpha subunit/fumarate hydratase class I-like protein
VATIKQSDFIQSVADALQYISYYHPEDFITNLTRAYELEQSLPPKTPWPRSSSTLRCAP